MIKRPGMLVTPFGRQPLASSLMVCLFSIFDPIPSRGLSMLGRRTGSDCLPHQLESSLSDTSAHDLA